MMAPCCMHLFPLHTSKQDNPADFIPRRYLRARKFDVEGAVGQFTDTEKWLKEQQVEELYEHFDVDFYERARTMVPTIYAVNFEHLLTFYSILSGLATEISEAFLSTSMRSKVSTVRLSINTRKSRLPTKPSCPITRNFRPLPRCYRCSPSTTTSSISFFLCVRLWRDLVLKYLSPILPISSISPALVYVNSGT